MTNRIERWARAAVLFCVASIFIQLILWKPFFGLMDDHTNLFFLIPKVHQYGMWHEIVAFIKSDFDWGMIRILYIPQMFSFYSIGLLFGPLPLYLFNAVLSATIYAFLSWVLARILRISVWLVLLGVGATFYSYDLFQHPSLQEKQVLCVGALLLWAVQTLDWSNRAKAPVVATLMLLGTVNKASFFIYLAMSAVLIYGSVAKLPVRRRIFIVGGFGAWIAALFLVTAWVSAHGQYTSSGYQSAKAIANFFSFTCALMLAPIILGIVTFGPAAIRTNAYEKLVPAVGCLTYLMIFLPWGIGGYIQTVIAPVYAALLVQLIDHYLPTSHRYWVPVVIAVACAFALYRPYSMFIRLGDIGDLIAAAPRLEAAGVKKILVPCSEGSLAIGRYLRHYASTRIETSELKSSDYRTGDVLFFDQGLCTLPGRVRMPPGCEGEALLTSRFSRGFRLVRLRCDSPT